MKFVRQKSDRKIKFFIKKLLSIATKSGPKLDKKFTVALFELEGYINLQILPIIYVFSYSCDVVKSNAR